MDIRKTVAEHHLSRRAVKHTSMMFLLLLFLLLLVGCCCRGKGDGLLFNFVAVVVFWIY